MTKKFTKEHLYESVLTAMRDQQIVETANTVAADVNEIMLGYHCGGGWGGYKKQAGEVKKALAARKKQLDPEAYKDQDGRARVMAAESLNWAAANGFDGKVVQIWWTARPGILGQAVGAEVDSRKNPTDVLVKFSDGGFLGLSAKSTKGKGDIGFKNPGLGSLSQKLGIDLVSPAKDIMEKAIKKMKLPLNSKERKVLLRDPKNARLNAKAKEVGDKILKTLRDQLLEHYLNIWEDDLKEHFVSAWIDAGENYPYYIKVTGRGTKGNYSATISDPGANPKFKALSADDIELEELGTNSIGVWAGDMKIMRIRFKWESQPLASSIKLSGDPF